MPWFGYIIVLIVALLIIYFTPDTAYRNYDCWDRSPYRCRRCKRKCIWKHIVKKYDELEHFCRFGGRK